jgi:short-subunit dehydrogenase
VADSFAGLRVVVTGAAGGIGSALCRRFAAEGAEVVALDLDTNGLTRLAGEVEVETHAVDLVNRAQVTETMAEIGPVDVLVNNAGVTALGPFSELPLDVLDRVLAVNLVGSANITRAALAGLIERRGRIGVMSSVAGFSPLIHRTAYAASKHALHGLFESLRTELAATRVTVTMISPAFTDTGIERRAVARAEGEAGEWSTTGRHMTPDRVARAIVEGLRRRRRLVLVGTTAKLAYVTSRLSPALYERLMRARISR